MRTFLLSKLLQFSIILCLNSTLAYAASCEFQNIYNSGEKTYIFHNALKNLALKQAHSVVELQNQWAKATYLAQQSCGDGYSLKLSDVLKKSNYEYSAEIGNKTYTLGYLGTTDNYTFYISRKTSNYAGQPFFLAHVKSNQIDFLRITGREGIEESTELYNFTFSPLVNKKTLIDFNLASNIASLKTVYNGKTPVNNLNLSVGVIGTGVDYNHPGLAKQLAFRYEMEGKILELEELQEKLKYHIYTNALSYLTDQSNYEKMVKNIGFPRWMDQALYSTRPFDRVITDQSTNGIRYHETLIISRIIYNTPNVKVYSVRRRMGSSGKVLNVEKIMAEFAAADVKVVNMSFGSSCGKNPEEEKMWDQAFKKYSNIIFVLAAGNSGLNIDESPHCPALYSKKYNNVISVTAADLDGLAEYNGKSVNYGMNVDLAIPADKLEVLVPFRYNSNKITEPNGASSIATAEVTRIIVEALNEGLNVDPQQVKSQLIKSSFKVPSLYEKVRSSGLVDEQKFKALLIKTEIQN